MSTPRYAATTPNVYLSAEELSLASTTLRVRIATFNTHIADTGAMLTMPGVAEYRATLIRERSRMEDLAWRFDAVTL